MAYVGRKSGNAALIAADIPSNLHLLGDYVKIPSATTTERDALTPAVGMMLYNTTLGILQQYAASGWASIDSPPTVSGLDYPGDDTALDIVGEFNLTCTTQSSTTVLASSTTGIVVGQVVKGTGIPTSPVPTVVSIITNTSFVLSGAATASASVALTFNTQTLIIAGTNFQSGATVTIDGTAPSTVTRNSSTQLTATGMPAKTAGTKVDGLVVSNPSGLAGSINVDYSALPAWTTASGNVLTGLNGAISTIDLAATSATSYAITSGALPTGLAMSTSTGDITGTMSGSAATYNFTVTATDAEAQTSPRLFNIISRGTATTNALLLDATNLTNTTVATGTPTTEISLNSGSLRNATVVTGASRAQSHYNTSNRLGIKDTWHQILMGSIGSGSTGYYFGVHHPTSTPEGIWVTMDFGANPSFSITRVAGGVIWAGGTWDYYFYGSNTDPSQAGTSGTSGAFSAHADMVQLDTIIGNTGSTYDTGVFTSGYYRYFTFRLKPQGGSYDIGWHQSKIYGSYY
jgi:hypothetical protein